MTDEPTDEEIQKQWEISNRYSDHKMIVKDIGMLARHFHAEGKKHERNRIRQAHLDADGDHYANIECRICAWIDGTEASK